MPHLESNSLEPARVLSLDGGGVRGLSALMILQTLMNHLGDQEKAAIGTLRPCDYFDIICGTSTGGLIAILLGRLRLTTKQAIDEYLRLSKRIFEEEKGHSVLGTVLRVSKKGEARFSAQKLKDAIKEVVKKYSGDSEASMYEEPSEQQRACHAFVLAVIADKVNNPDPHSFTTYERNDETTIWEAARATSAAFTFFEEMIIGTPGVRYIDAGLGFNNPGKVACDEVDRLWPGREIGVFVSLGTGKEPPSSLEKQQPSWWNVGLRGQIELLKALKDLATSASGVDNALDRRFHSYRCKTEYYRFNVDQGLETIGLQEWEKMNQLAGFTQAYLNNAQTYRSQLACVKRIRELTNKAMPYELSAGQFTVVHEDDRDSDYPSMALWYREEVDHTSGYPSNVRVDPQFRCKTVRPVGSTILSSRRFVNLLIRGQAFDIPHGRYRIKWVVWYFRGQAPTIEENSVTQRKFPSIIPGQDASVVEPGHFPPFNVLYSVGRAKEPMKFMHKSIDVNTFPDSVPVLLRDGYKQQMVDSGLWNTLKDTGWCEIGNDLVDVELDGHLAMIISMKFQRSWFGGFSFGGVRLEPIRL